MEVGNHYIYIHKGWQKLTIVIIQHYHTLSAMYKILSIILL